MAFNSGNTASASSTPANDNWKAQGFLNLSLPSQDGGKVKLGAIPLKASNPREKALIEWLTEDPTRVEAILSKLIIEYRSAEPKAGSSFDLG